MKLTCIVTIILFGVLACTEKESERSNARADFFENLISLCGETFEGNSVYPDDPEHELYEADLLMDVAECTETEIRIPFQVNDDKSRTWIITYSDDKLLLKHDHRYPDGTPHNLTNYGGIAHNEGSASAQYFEADTETAEMLPETSTNVWLMEINEKEGTFVYYLERHNEPRYRAEFRVNP